MTPPNTSSPDEQVKASSRAQKHLETFIIKWFPPLAKAAFWAAFLAETSLILVSQYPDSSISRRISPLLTTHLSNEPQLSLPCVLGSASALIGGLIRRACYRQLSTFFTFELSIRKNHSLVTTGPYSIVRHPSYTGALLAGAGMIAALASRGSWLIECSGLGNFLGLSPLSLSSEEQLHSQLWGASALLTCISIFISVTSAGLLAIIPRMNREDEMLKKQFGKEWEEWYRNVRYRLVRGIY